MRIRDLIVTPQIGFYRPEQPGGSEHYAIRPADVFIPSDYGSEDMSARNWEKRVLVKRNIKRYYRENSLVKNFCVQDGDLLICCRNRFAGHAVGIAFGQGNNYRIVPQTQDWYLLRFKDRSMALKVILYLRGTFTGQMVLRQLIKKKGNQKIIGKRELLDLEVPVDDSWVLKALMSDVNHSRLVRPNYDRIPMILLLDEDYSYRFPPVNEVLSAYTMQVFPVPKVFRENPIMWERTMHLFSGDASATAIEEMRNK